VNKLKTTETADCNYSGRRKSAPDSDKKDIYQMYTFISKLAKNRWHTHAVLLS